MLTALQAPTAWIHTQFAVANVGSAILVCLHLNSESSLAYDAQVTSNPTNLVLAGAFNIKFINYTANVIIPVVVTAIVMLPFLLFIVFPSETL